ncbi:unnamed protein product [Rodentolepis nana]|uniref:NPC1_N domain-containing protein n=1 Tax=Rodentolepis nana TaxID=102285 RepID=A0A0R3TXE3_RODNA|nr:unnamed protein product [Rodentolepis nana]
MAVSSILLLVTVITSWNLVYSQNSPGNYFNSPQISRDKSPVFSIGCDCFSVPDCFSNCSAVPDLLPLLRKSSQFLQTFPSPFTVTKPQQFRKRSFKFDTSTANKRVSNCSL